MSAPNYTKTKIACYLGFITQAIAANFAPLLFLKFHYDYQISIGNIAWISTCFFFTQLLVDLFCTKFVDRIGYRVCIVASEVCAAGAGGNNGDPKERNKNAAEALGMSQRSSKQRKWLSL